MPTFIAALEIPTPSDYSFPTTSNLNVLKKRNCLSELASPPKKGLGVPMECVETPHTTPLTSITLEFTPGSFEISPARAIFKATRKGKNKLVQMVHDPENHSIVKGGFAKPPQQP